MDWDLLIGKRFLYQGVKYQVIRLISQQEDTIVAEVFVVENDELKNEKNFILKIDISQREIFKSQIWKEKKIHDKLENVFRLYDFFIFPIDEDMLFDEYEIVYRTEYQDIFDKFKNQEYFPFLGDNERKDNQIYLTREKEESFPEFVLAALMPYLGKSLSYDFLYNYGKQLYPNEPTKILENTFDQSLQFLNHLHSHGIYYADIKPGNILFSPENNKITIIDYGTSLEGNVNCIKNPNVGGTPIYISPYIQYKWTFLNGKFRIKNPKSYCYATKFDDYIGLYYTFLDVSGVILPWNKQNVDEIINKFLLFDKMVLRIYGNRSEETIKQIENGGGFDGEHEKFWKWCMDENNFFSIINYSKIIDGVVQMIDDTTPLLPGIPDNRIIKGIKITLLFYLKLKYSLPNYIPTYLDNFIHQYQLIDKLTEEGITQYFMNEHKIL